MPTATKFLSTNGINFGVKTVLNPITLHRVSSAELSQLQQISRATFAETFSDQNTEEDMAAYLDKAFSEKQLYQELSNPESEFYFARAGREIIGYLKVNAGAAQTECKEENSLEVERIYVSKDFQGKKIGQLLFQKGMELARQKDMDFVWLGVWEKNTKAIRFYEKNGFKAFDTHSFLLGSDQQTDILMRFTLK